MGASRGAVLAGVAAGLTACALFTDTSGFTGDDPKEQADSGTDTTPIDANVEDTAAVVDASDAGDASFDGPSFHDDFERDDSPVIGNGWVEKTPDVFDLIGGAAVKSDAGSIHYHDALVYRPQSEDRADVEASAVLVLGTGVENPQIFVRAQRSTVTTPMAYEAYILFLSSDSKATVARQRGPLSEVVLAATSLPPLVAGQRIRLTLRATDEMPVKLEAFIDRIEAGTSTRIGAVSFADDTVDRLSTPGATGFTAAYNTVVTVDDFEWRALGTR